jgi:hypothetical protein
MNKPTAVRERFNLPPLEPTPNLPAIQTQEPTALRRSLPAPVANPHAMMERAEAILVILVRLEEVLTKWESALAKMKVIPSVEVFENAAHLRECREGRADQSWAKRKASEVTSEEACGQRDTAKKCLKRLEDYAETRRNSAIRYLTTSIFDREEDGHKRMDLVKSMSQDVNGVYNALVL